MKREKFWNGLVKVLWGAVLVLLGFTLASTFGTGRRHSKMRISDSEWSKLMLVLGVVDNDYVDKIDKEEVTERILPLIMAELDPHSMYLPPEDLRAADEDLQGGFEGIGVQFNMPEDTVVVTAVIGGGPSEKAGLMTGDRIVTVNGRNIAGIKFQMDSVVKLLKGPRGTKVTVGIARGGEQDVLPFDIVRDVIPVNSVDVAYMADDTTGYIKLEKFARTSYVEFLKAVAQLQEQGMKKLIFDLRGNSGGYLDQALLLCNEFLDKGDLIVYMEGRNAPRQDMFADGRGTCREVELAVLIDEGSASSSEIFAGAIQDNDRGTIYGLRSFGKGLVQEPRYFSDGSGIRITVARYFTPSGRCIQKPYVDYGESHFDDIIARYSSGEMMSADSIKVNDSLKFNTIKKGRTVYGGGGIIPDVFVPLDTTGVSDYLIRCNRQSLLIKYANLMADKYRSSLRSIKDMDSLDKFLDSIHIEDGFIEYTSSLGVVPSKADWKISGDIILIQIRALIGRYTPMGDNAFYPIYLTIDNTMKRAMEPISQ
ncbi:MAG: S41 family peptidase [Bacteroidales bacterium]|nr:S41 family peptidase [Candidatus Cacconaster merdequi]